MSLSDEDSNQNSIDTLRSAIFENPPKQRVSNEKKKLSFSSSKNYHVNDRFDTSYHSMKENRSYDVSDNINKSAEESQLLGARLTNEIKRLRHELSICSQQKHEALHLLQTKQQEASSILKEKDREIDNLRIRNKEIEWERDNLQREMVSE